MSDNRPIQVRFETYFTKSVDCWNWEGGLTYNGYGRFKIDYKSLKAHRVSYELYIGKIPAGLSVMHMCDNPACVNPQHLTLGTMKENVRDCFVKGRRAVKLRPSDISHIRDLLACSLFTVHEVAGFYGVSFDAVRDIQTNKRWAFT